MSKQGYIKLYRQITDTPVWADSDKLKLWLMCLMKATHDEKTQVVGNQIIELKAGQFITGRSALSDEFNRDVKKDRRVDGLTLFRWLSLFEKMEMLNIKKTNKYSLVTVLNWDKYQGQRTSNEQQLNNKRTSNEQQLNTNKNDKNVKNVKNEKKEDICYQQIADMYNNTCVSFPRLTKLSDARKKAIKARLKTYTADDLQKAFFLAEQSDFLKGANNRNWSATFDWMLKDTNLAKILDGNYTNNSNKTGSTEKQLPAWWDNQDLIKTDPEFDEEEFDRKIEELRNSL
ncbi:hypothetical protein [[Clostridium] innocuum]|uniref:hypothetical protein n=1 Tax=Clostridium innocuum TaxID=1522 RepID=UPI0022E16939|nr:hypothetical protein [[Clostridium] innocuum]